MQISTNAFKCVYCLFSNFPFQCRFVNRHSNDYSIITSNIGVIYESRPNVTADAGAAMAREPASQGGAAMLEQGRVQGARLWFLVAVGERSLNQNQRDRTEGPA